MRVPPNQCRTASPSRERTPKAIAVAWQTGSYMQTGTPLAAGQAYWDGTAWVAGAAPLAASASKATAGAGK